MAMGTFRLHLCIKHMKDMNGGKHPVFFFISGQGMLRCGTSNVYIKPECVCSFYNVYEAKYHNHTSCPQGGKSDGVTKLKCR